MIFFESNDLLIDIDGVWITPRSNDDLQLALAHTKFLNNCALGGKISGVIAKNLIVLDARCSKRKPKAISQDIDEELP